MLRPAPIAVSRPEVFSIDNEVALASHKAHSDVIILRVTGNFTPHPLLSDGDVLLIECCGICDRCSDSTWLAVNVRGNIALVKKGDATVSLNRSQIRAVGSPHTPAVLVLGRVLAWVGA